MFSKYVQTLIIICVITMASCGQKGTDSPDPEVEEVNDQTQYFSNPIGGYEADPWVVFKDGFYYYTATNGGSIVIRKSKNLHEVAKVQGITVWQPSPDGEIKNAIWAPELHFIGDRWYVYAAGSPCGDFTKCFQESFVLESTTEDPLGSYEYKGIIAEGIDGTVLQRDNGDNYFLWMRTADGETEHISIAKMISPWEIEEDITKVSIEPFLDWETRDQYTNEGPEILQRGDTTLVIYSASASWTQWYCLGAYINVDGNLMNKESWTKYPEPLFEKSDVNYIYGPGHCAFTQSPDGTEDWIIYHAMSDPNGGWGGRQPRIQKFTWQSNGLPDFGVPVPDGKRIEVPSGTE